MRIGIIGPTVMVWIVCGFKTNDWVQVFKLLKQS
jgi:hypothetical protein